MDTEQDFEQDSQLVKDLRKQLRDAHAANKKLETDLTEFKSKFRQQSVAEALKAKGVNPKIAKLIPDGVDDVDAWLTEFGDVFGATAPEPPQQESPVDTETKAQLQRQNSLQERSLTPDKIADLEQRVANAASQEEIDAALSEFANYQL